MIEWHLSSSYGQSVLHNLVSSLWLTLFSLWKTIQLEIKTILVRKLWNFNICSGIDFYSSLSCFFGESLFFLSSCSLTLLLLYLFGFKFSVSLYWFHRVSLLLQKCRKMFCMFSSNALSIMLDCSESGNGKCPFYHSSWCSSYQNCCI